MAKRKKGMTFIPYDYEAAYNKSLEDMHEFFVEQMFKHGKKVVYALKEIRAGDQFEVEIYPQFKKMDEVPPEGRSIKKDNDKAQRNLNDKNARKYVERLINENFTDSGAIRVHMSSLRRKLKAVLGHDVIMNKVGEGYKIREESDR